MWTMTVSLIISGVGWAQADNRMMIEAEIAMGRSRWVVVHRRGMIRFLLLIRKGLRARRWCGRKLVG